jgi:hypothetical protein
MLPLCRYDSRYNQPVLALYGTWFTYTEQWILIHGI